MIFTAQKHAEKSLKFHKIFSKFELLERPVSGRWAKLLMLNNYTSTRISTSRFCSSV